MVELRKVITNNNEFILKYGKPEVMQVILMDFFCDVVVNGLKLSAIEGNYQIFK